PTKNRRQPEAEDSTRDNAYVAAKPRASPARTALRLERPWPATTSAARARGRPHRAGREERAHQRQRGYGHHAGSTYRFDRQRPALGVSLGTDSERAQPRDQQRRRPVLRQ